VIDPERARRVKLLGLDVDGVLTDNGLWIGAVDGRRVEFKKFDVQDGIGFVLLRYAGLEVCWVSGRESEATALRARELKIAELVQESTATKLGPVQEILTRRGLGWDQLAWVGDDIADIPILRKAGLAIAPDNAVAEVKALAHHVTTRGGGAGAVRELVVDLLIARGEYDGALRRFLEERGDQPL
jgi:3-deoxy-D-manno-octulosonate 8-phosphate phosphatase (KDO 8-P phosphatase)